MRYFFLFHYGGRYYRFISLLFGWVHSALWFFKLLRPRVENMRYKMAYRVLSYLDDFRIAPTASITVAVDDYCSRAVKILGALLKRLIIVRHP